jgi:hypothetical protein
MSPEYDAGSTVQQCTARRTSLAPLACFLLLTFGLSWAIEIPAAFAVYGWSSIRMPREMQTLAQLTPALAVLLTTCIFSGARALLPLLGGVTRVRARAGWYLLALLLAPATQAAAVLYYRLMGFAVPARSAWTGLVAMTAALAIFSVGEELGWRGVFPAAPAGRQRSPAGCRMGSAVLGSVAPPLLLGRQLGRQELCAVLLALPSWHLSGLHLLCSVVRAYRKRAAMHALPRILKCRSRVLVRTDGPAPALRYLDGAL